MRFSATSTLALVGLLVTPVLSAPINVHGGSNSITNLPVQAGLEKQSPMPQGPGTHHNPLTIVKRDPKRDTGDGFSLNGAANLILQCLGKPCKPKPSGPKLAKRMDVAVNVQHPVAGVVGVAPNTIAKRDPKRDTGDGFSLNGAANLILQCLGKPCKPKPSGPKLAKRMDVAVNVQHPVAGVVGAAPNTIAKRDPKRDTGDGFSLNGTANLILQCLGKPCKPKPSGPKLAKRSPMTQNQGTHHNPTTIVERDVLEYGDLVRHQDARGGPKKGN